MVMKREYSALWKIVIIEEDGQHSWVRLYWSQNSGRYGHQVVWERCLAGEEFETGQTTGGGYCKVSSAFETFVADVIGRYPGRVGGYEPDQFYRLFVEGSEDRQGNYIKMTRAQLENGVALANREDK